MSFCYSFSLTVSNSQRADPYLINVWLQGKEYPRTTAFFFDVNVCPLCIIASVSVIFEAYLLHPLCFGTSVVISAEVSIPSYFGSMNFFCLFFLSIVHYTCNPYLLWCVREHLSRSYTKPATRFHLKFHVLASKL